MVNMDLRELVVELEGYRTYEPGTHAKLKQKFDALQSQRDNLSHHDKLLADKLKSQWDLVSKVVVQAHEMAKEKNKELYADRAQQSLERYLHNHSLALDIDEATQQISSKKTIDADDELDKLNNKRGGTPESVSTPSLEVSEKQSFPFYSPEQASTKKDAPEQDKVKHKKKSPKHK